MDIKTRKKEILNDIAELEQDIVKLQNNILRFKELCAILPDNISEEELEKLDEEFDVEKDLKHIRLF